MSHRDTPLFLFRNPVAAEGFSFALVTSSALPDAVEVVGGGIDQLGIVGEDAGFEVAVVVAFHADAGTCEVGGTDVGGSTVKIIILKCTLGQSLRSNLLHNPGYLSKSSRKLSPGSLACSRRTSTPRFNNLSSTDRNGTTSRPPSTYKSLRSAVPIHKSCLTFSQSANTFV